MAGRLISIAENGYPVEYDLVQITFDDGTDKFGWWTGQVWDGRSDFENKVATHWCKSGYQILTAYDK